MSEIARDLRMPAWIGTPGWQFNRLTDRLEEARKITGDERVGVLIAEADAVRDELLGLLPRIQAMLEEAAAQYEVQAVAVAALPAPLTATATRRA
jgi:hypothetical protein